MATAYVRHQLHLHGHQIKPRLLALLLLALPTAALAQKSGYTKAKRGKNGQVKSITVNNLPAYDERVYRPGFCIGLNASRYRLEHSQLYTNRISNGTGIAANAKVSPGFAVGFVNDLRLGDYWNLRFIPGVSFLTRQIEFKPVGSVAEEINDQEIGSTQVDLPLLVKFKSERRRNTRVYMVGGVRHSFNVGNRRKDPERNQMQVGTQEFALEYGVGLDLFYPFFKFAPELRFSHGLSNLSVAAPDVYSQSFRRIRTNTVTLYFTFE